MKKAVFSFVASLLFGVVVGTGAQSLGSMLWWDQDAPTAADAQKYTYRLFVDGAAVGVVLAGVTCTSPVGSTVELCSAPLPSLTPGVHTIALSAASAQGESAKSTLLTATVVVVPAPPTNLRIK